MGVKVLLFTLIQGMNQDLSPSKRTSKLAYEIKNMRITIEDDNTLLSWSNEKGTKLIVICDYDTGALINNISGTVLGTCVLNNYLVLFIYNTPLLHTIYGINFNTTMPILYKYFEGNLNFKLNSKFETLGVFENELILKIYWIDGINQPRYINIALDINIIRNGTKYLFDFLPYDDLNLQVDIIKQYSTGLFKAGTILYAFNYYNLNGSLTNIVYTTPVQYIAPSTKGGNVDELTNCAFKIQLSNLNKDFDYLRIYSISRASVDTTPQVRIVNDIPITTSIGGTHPVLVGSEIKTEVILIPKTIYTVNRITREDYEDARNFRGSTSNSPILEYVLTAGGYLLGNTINEGHLQKDSAFIFENCFYEPEYGAYLNIYRNGVYTTVEAFFDEAETKRASWTRWTNYSLKSNTTYTTETVTHTVPIYKEVSSLDYIDNGEGGEIFDYNALLFMNNLPLVPLTMDLKDNTLFLGNLKYYTLHDLDLKKALSKILLDSSIFVQKQISELSLLKNLFYPYINLLQFPSDKILGFKGGDHYLFGITILDYRDRWSSIIPLGGPIVNHLYPKVIDTGSSYETYLVQAELSEDLIQLIKDTLFRVLENIIQNNPNDDPDIYKFKSFKIVIVSTSESQRKVLCQGVLASTVYSLEDRCNGNLPYAQSSWFFRPMMLHEPSYYLPLLRSLRATEDLILLKRESNNGTILEFRHYYDVDEEILINEEGESGFRNDPRTEKLSLGYSDITRTSYPGHFRYGVDNLIVTFHSPDIEFNSSIQGLLKDNNAYKFRIVGYTKVHATYADSNINAEATSFLTSYGYATTCRLNTNKFNNIYNLKFPAAGLSDYFGVYGTTEGDEKSLGEHVHGDEYTLRGYYLIHPWHRSTSLNALNKIIEDKNGNLMSWQYPLKKKVISNVRCCAKTILGENKYWRPLSDNDPNKDTKTGISCIEVWDETDRLIKISDPTLPFNKELTYQGTIDTVLNYAAPSINESVTTEETDYNIHIYQITPERNSLSSEKISILAPMKVDDFIRMKYKSSTHAVFNLNYHLYKNKGTLYWLQWTLPYPTTADEIITNLDVGENSGNILWVNDSDTSSVGGNTSNTTENVHTNPAVYNAIGNSKFNNFANKSYGELMTLAYIAIKGATGYSLDTMYLGENGYGIFEDKQYNIIKKNEPRPAEATELDSWGENEEWRVLIITEEISPGLYKYYVLHRHKFSLVDLSHGNLISSGDILEFETLSNGYKINNKGSLYTIVSENCLLIQTAGTSTEVNTSIGSIGNGIAISLPYKVEDSDDGIFYIGELYHDAELNTEEFDLSHYTWLDASKEISLLNSSPVPLFGDTYFLRYDCLKTYAYSSEDINLIVDIGSFMLETRINIDGRWDRNRGLLSNNDIDNTNFNLLNKAYSQLNKNTLSYNLESLLKLSVYPNTITWTLTKIFGEQIDSWTKLTSTSILDLDGNQGELKKLLNYHNTITFFQEDALGVINYNDRVALQVDAGLPVELANSGKVDGKTYLNKEIGCLNKDTIAVTKNAVYFIDGHTNTIYQIKSPESLVTPVAISDNSFEVFLNNQDTSLAKTFYNRDMLDVYFIFKNNKDYPCLTYNEQIEGFSSFYDYIPSFLCNIGKEIYHLLNDNGHVCIWEQNTGDYNYFYDHTGNNKYSPFYITVVANGDESIKDKIWNNLEFRSDSWNIQNQLLETTFDTLTSWNEYLSAELTLTKYGKTLNGTGSSINIPSSLKKKFRIWRANFPRIYKGFKECFINVKEKTIPDIPDKEGIVNIYYEDLKASRDRIRNPWTYVQLKMNTPNTNRTVLHDMIVHYYE